MLHECYMIVTFRFCHRSQSKSLKLPVFKGFPTDLWLYRFIHISFYPLYQSPEFMQRVQELESFLIDKGHFPFSSSEDNAEINLRQWWHRNNSNDSLNDVQLSEIKRLQDAYWYLPTDKREVRWFFFFNRYREFILEYGRKPSCYIEREKSLAEWFSKTQREFVEGELSENEEKVYLHLCKIL